MKSEMLKYLSVALGPIAGVILKLGWLETAICSAVGMMFTVVAITYIGKGVQLLVQRYQKKPSKRFTKTNRLAVKVWNKFGIIGIAFLTPPLFTPIFGPILAVALKVPRSTIFLWMSVSAVVWGLSISYIAHKMTFLHTWFR